MNSVPNLTQPIINVPMYRSYIYRYKVRILWYTIYRHFIIIILYIPEKTADDTLPARARVIRSL